MLTRVFNLVPSIKLASKARLFLAVIRQRLSNVLDFVLRPELEENVLISRKTAKVDE